MIKNTIYNLSSQRQYNSLKRELAEYFPKRNKVSSIPEKERQ